MPTAVRVKRLSREARQRRLAIRRKTAPLVPGIFQTSTKKVAKLNRHGMWRLRPNPPGLLRRVTRGITGRRVASSPVFTSWAKLTREERIATVALFAGAAVSLGWAAALSYIARQDTKAAKALARAEETLARAEEYAFAKSGETSKTETIDLRVKAGNGHVPTGQTGSIQEAESILGGG